MNDYERKIAGTSVGDLTATALALLRLDGKDVEAHVRQAESIAESVASEIDGDCEDAVERFAVHALVAATMAAAWAASIDEVNALVEIEMLTDGGLT